LSGDTSKGREMYYSKLFFMVMAILIIADAVYGDTFYMRNGESFIAEIISENPIEYKVKKQEGFYSFIYEADAIKKLDIYALINVLGELVYPIDLRLKITESPFKSLPDNELRKYYYIRQIEQNDETNKHINAIETILFIQLLAVIAAGIVIAFSK